MNTMDTMEPTNITQEINTDVNNSIKNKEEFYTPSYRNYLDQQLKDYDGYFEKIRSVTENKTKVHLHSGGWYGNLL